MERQTKLSKGILELKFMKRSKEKFEQQEDEDERQQLYNDKLSTLESGAERVSLVPSHFDCYEYLPCRMSFGGFEPETEKQNLKKLKGLYTPLRVAAEVEDPEGGMQVDVSAQDFNSFMRTNKNDGQNDKQGFQHKNTNVNRFQQRPAKDKHAFDKDRSKYSKDNRRPAENDGSKQRRGGGNRSFQRNNDEESNGYKERNNFKRKSNQFEQNEADQKPRKFLKPPA